ncbi:MAG: serine O-acetyltransferase [Pseudomonadota bacterium]
MSFWDVVKQDIYVFKHKQPGGAIKYLYFPDIRAAMIFRLSQLAYRFILTRPLAYALTTFNDLFHGVWMGPRVTAGKGLMLAHPRGVVMNPDTVIGDYCTILTQVTIGGPSVTIGNYVEIGAGAKIISLEHRPIVIGAHAVIGAGAVVTRSVEPGEIVVGNPARSIGQKDMEQWLNARPYYIPTMDVSQRHDDGPHRLA